MNDSLSLGPLSRALLRAAAEGRLHRVGSIYRWHPRTAVRRAHTSPGITETGTQLHAFGLISHHERDTTCALTERGRAALADPRERNITMAKSTDSSNNPGTPLGKALKDARKTADQRGQTGRQR